MDFNKDRYNSKINFNLFLNLLHGIHVVCSLPQISLGNGFCSVSPRRFNVLFTLPHPLAVM